MSKRSSPTGYSASGARSASSSIQPHDPTHDPTHIDFSAEDKEEITIKDKEIAILQVTGKEDESHEEDWELVRSPTSGREGYVPMNYLEKMNDTICV